MIENFGKITLTNKDFTTLFHLGDIWTHKKLGYEIEIIGMEKFACNHSNDSDEFSCFGYLLMKSSIDPIEHADFKITGRGSCLHPSAVLKYYQKGLRS